MACMAIPPKGMATMLKRSKADISVARSRLYGKLYGTPGTEQKRNLRVLKEILCTSVSLR